MDILGDAMAQRLIWIYTRDHQIIQRAAFPIAHIVLKVTPRQVLRLRLRRPERVAASAQRA